MVRTMSITGVMLRRSGRIKAGLEERMLNRFHTLSRKDCRCNDKQMLQSNRTVAGPFLRAFGRIVSMSHAISFAYRGPSRR